MMIDYSMTNERSFVPILTELNNHRAPIYKNETDFFFLLLLLLPSCNPLLSCLEPPEERHPSSDGCPEALRVWPLCHPDHQAARQQTGQGLEEFHGRPGRQEQGPHPVRAFPQEIWGC